MQKRLKFKLLYNVNLATEQKRALESADTRKH